MTFGIIRKANPKTLLNLFVTGSLGVLLLCLLGSAVIFTFTFMGKERERAAISKEQLEQSFSFQYRPIAEEMFTKSYDAILMRVKDIADRFGHADFELTLADPKGACVFLTADQKEVPCGKKRVAESIARLGAASGRRGILEFNEHDGRYLHLVPLYLGANLQGYLIATISDPFGFYRGNALIVAARIFFPAVAIILLVWAGFLLLSRRYILKPYFRSLVEMEKSEALGKLAAQVAHDVQSPLAAVMSVAQSSSTLSATETRLLRSATSQIHHLTNDLLTRYRNKQEPQALGFSLVAPIIHSVVSEKTVVLGDRSSVILVQSIDASLSTVGVYLSSTTLSRVLSNLLNNAVEATERGTIKLIVQGSPLGIRISIRDPGCGIPSNILERLRTVGGTYGKANGAGLGLQYARETVQAAGGKLSISSSPGAGTVVDIDLPIAEVPSWCASELTVLEGTRLLVLDDDESVHYLWKTRLVGCDVEFIRSTQEFDRDRHQGSEYRYIFDYEIRGSQATGMDLIRQFNLGPRATLVTSYFSDERIQMEAAELGTRILPKILIPQVRIVRDSGAHESVNKPGPDLVLIDDNPIVHTIWKSAAQKTNHSVLCLDDDEGFTALAVPLTTPIFLDKNLKNGKSGIDVGRTLYKAGYRNLHLTTGERACDVGAANHFLSVRGKEFPLRLQLTQCE